MHPSLTPGIDVALLVSGRSSCSSSCLVFYLRREDRREGYPLEDELTGPVETAGGPLHTASTKTFLLPFGHGSVTAPTKDREPVDIAARRTDRFAGAPYAPTGNPLVDGIGPAAWADRAKRPDLDMEGHPRIVPISMPATASRSRAAIPIRAAWPVSAPTARRRRRQPTCGSIAPIGSSAISKSRWKGSPASRAAAHDHGDDRSPPGQRRRSTRSTRRNSPARR